jgi:hypothetical protein
VGDLQLIGTSHEVLGDGEALAGPYENRLYFHLPHAHPTAEGDPPVSEGPTALLESPGRMHKAVIGVFSATAVLVQTSSQDPDLPLSRNHGVSHDHNTLRSPLARQKLDFRGFHVHPLRPEAVHELLPHALQFPE